MKRKCDQCNQPATYHSVKIVKGQKIEEHLCEAHAAQAGLVPKEVQVPINELLTNFVKLHSGATLSTQELTCPNCNMTFTEFREHSLLGCPNCYAAFEPSLASLLERAHEGATHHIGKVPRRAGKDEHRQQRLLRMRKQLADAVAAEDYESAARLRDQIRAAEGEPA